MTTKDKKEIKDVLLEARNGNFSSIIIDKDFIDGFHDYLKSDETDGYGNNILMYAVKYNKEKIVRYILDVDHLTEHFLDEKIISKIVKINLNYQNILTIASIEGHTEIIRYILDILKKMGFQDVAKCLIFKKDYFDKSPFIYLLEHLE